MKEKIGEYLKAVESFKAESLEQIEEFRIQFLSKKGKIPALFADFKNVAADERKEVGQLINTLKKTAQEKIILLKESLDSVTESGDSGLDLSLPANLQLGSRHPLSIVRNEIVDIFSRIGFNVAEGPEIEDDFHNFTALNFPENHPARDMQDTFFIETDPDLMLRTHTSSVQIRVMQETKPPIRVLLPGRVFRNEAISARAHCIFHQVEGLSVDTNVSFADLKTTLYYFAQELFGADTKVRFRPSFFPFTEPSAEMDISCNFCHGKGCNICKYTGWVEILGCGMVDPNVLEFCNIDSSKYTGYAFGMGIERVTMLKYQINDLRLFFENDIRFLKQFQSSGF
jgi:phenylalanyl-tRNA synthetase alpha chain